MIIIIMKKSQEMMVFSGRQKLTSAMKLRPECSIQGCLHREPPEVGLVEKLTVSLYWWVELCVPTLHKECGSSLITRKWFPLQGELAPIKKCGIFVLIINQY